jgi:HEAT repeat protein
MMPRKAYEVLQQLVEARAASLSPWDGKQAWMALYELDRKGTSDALERGLTRGDVSWEWVLGVSQFVRAKGGAWARPAFSALTRHPDPRYQGAAADALSVIGDETSIDAVLGILAPEPDWVSQQRATAFLRAGLGVRGMFQRQAALRAAFAIARRTQTPVAERAIAAAAKDAVEQCQLMKELTLLVGCAWESKARGPIQSAVREALSDSEYELVTAAVRAATAYRFDELAPEVVATLAHPRWYSCELVEAWKEFVREVGARAIREVAHVVEAAIRADATATTVKCAERAIGLLEDFPAFGREHTALLVRALATSYSDLRDAAERSLGRLGTREAADALLETAGNASPATAYRVVKVLTQLEEPRVVQVALRLLAPFLAGGPIATYDEGCLYENCIHALQTIGGADALDGLRRCLDHADRRMRRDAADALGAMGEPSVIAWLEPLVHDQDSQVRAAAKKAIARLREASAR